MTNGGNFRHRGRDHARRPGERELYVGSGAWLFRAPESRSLPTAHTGHTTPATCPSAPCEIYQLFALQGARRAESLVTTSSSSADAVCGHQQGEANEAAKGRKILPPRRAGFPGPSHPCQGHVGLRSPIIARLAAVMALTGPPPKPCSHPRPTVVCPVPRTTLPQPPPSPCGCGLRMEAGRMSLGCAEDGSC